MDKYEIQDYFSLFGAVLFGMVFNWLIMIAPLPLPTDYRGLNYDHPC